MSPEILFNFYDHFVAKSGSIEAISKEYLYAYYLKQKEYANRWERILAFAYCELNESNFEGINTKKSKSSSTKSSKKRTSS